MFQEIVGRLWEAFGKYDRNRKFSTWMYRVALNVAIDLRRRRRGRETRSLEDAPAVVPSTPQQDSTKQNRLRELHELLKRQTDTDHSILLLYLEGHSYREIGEVIGVSESNIGTQLNRLKKSLRQSVRASHN